MGCVGVDDIIKWIPNNNSNALDGCRARVLSGGGYSRFQILRERESVGTRERAGHSAAVARGNGAVSWHSVRVDGSLWGCFIQLVTTIRRVSVVPPVPCVNVCIGDMSCESIATESLFKPRFSF